MRRLIFMIMEIKRNIADNHVSAYAAQAAYFIMLSLIPLLILLLSMIQFTGIGKADFYSLIQHLVPQGFQSWMLSIIDEMFSRTVATVSLSAVVTIWSAGKSFMALNRGFNAICRVDKNPNYVLMRLRGAVFALLFVVIIMVSLVLVVFGDSIHLWLVKYIPFGRENAIGRAELAMKVGCSDRTMRDLINTARKREVIVNIQNGSGYYRPTENDVGEVEKFKRQEENRAKDIFSGLQPVRKFLKSNG